MTRTAVADLGSNSFRLVVFTAEDGWWKRTDEIFESVRIGAGLAETGELAPDRIRVNAVSPGVILTPFHERFTTAAQLEAMKATVPMNRLGEPDECAGTFLYLSSEELSGYVTGQVIEVNGGQLMN